MVEAWRVRSWQVGDDGISRSAVVEGLSQEEAERMVAESAPGAASASKYIVHEPAAAETNDCYCEECKEQRRAKAKTVRASAKRSATAVKAAATRAARPARKRCACAAIDETDDFRARCPVHGLRHR